MHYFKKSVAAVLMVATFGVAQAQRPMAESQVSVVGEPNEEWTLPRDYARLQYGVSMMLVHRSSAVHSPGLHLGLMKCHHGKARNPWGIMGGLELNYNATKDGNAHERMFNLAVPIDLTWDIRMRHCYFEFLFGPNFRINLVGGLTYDDGSLDVDYFNSGAANRIQYGLNWGIGWIFRRTMLHYHISSDFDDYFSDEAADEACRTWYNFLSFGMRF